MKIGVPRERKDHEDRVAITPPGIHELTLAGHRVLLQKGAALGSAITDNELRSAGATMVADPADLWADAELVLKVKEPLPEEYDLMQAGQVLFTYLHLAASAPLTRAILGRGVTALGYETVQHPDGSLPLLAPMSEVAGRMAPQVGAYHLQRSCGGRGVLMGGVAGVRPARVAVLGAGVAGANAAAIAVGMGAEVTALDRQIAKLTELDHLYRGRVRTIASGAFEVEAACLDADLVIGAVLVPGARAPVLVTDDLVASMNPGSVLVDLAVDQGGCFESSRPTTHSNPTFSVGGSIFYCVANMPGAVPRTATYALTNVTLAYVLEIANRGWRDACRSDPSLASGLNAADGVLTNAAVAETHGLAWTPAEDLIGLPDGPAAGAAEA
jgi:alanine dehydrogenase